MIEFIERHMADGSMTARVRADGLPQGMRYCISWWPDGKVTAQSKANGKGSVRYYTHRSYTHALNHGYLWAKRKIAEANKKAQSTTGATA